jgi:hypothetical protein
MKPHRNVLAMVLLAGCELSYYSKPAKPQEPSEPTPCHDYASSNSFVDCNPGQTVEVVTTTVGKSVVICRCPKEQVR